MINNAWTCNSYRYYTGYNISLTTNKALWMDKQENIENDLASYSCDCRYFCKVSGVLIGNLNESYINWICRFSCCPNGARLQIMADIILKSTITCPECGHVETETMPTDACQFFYDCKKCSALLKALPGDCCVYCSYADVPCPPIQEGDNCCAG